MYTLGLENKIDDYMLKQAGVLGTPRSVAGVAGQTALYMTPFLGSGLSIADGISDFRKGNWKSGLFNTALGIGTGIADFFSLGTAGTAIRSLSLAAKGAKGVKGVVTAARAARSAELAAKAGKNIGALGKTWGQVVGASKAMGGAYRNILGQTINLGKGAARGALGAERYGKLINAGSQAAGFVRNTESAIRGSRAANAYRGARTWAGNTRLGQWARTNPVGKGVTGTARLAASWMVPVNGGSTYTARALFRGSEPVFNGYRDPEQEARNLGYMDYEPYKANSWSV